MSITGCFISNPQNSVLYTILWICFIIFSTSSMCPMLLITVDNDLEGIQVSQKNEKQEKKSIINILNTAWLVQMLFLK